MIGTTLKNLLDEREIKVNEFARQIKVPAQTLYSIIRRDNMKIDFELLLRICDALHVPLETFCGTGSTGQPTPEEWETLWKLRRLDDHGRFVTLQLLDGHIDIYLPDYKYYSSYYAGLYSHAEDYREFAVPAIDEMVRQTGAPQFDENGTLIVPDDYKLTITVSYDEKPGIQAISNTAPDLRPTAENGEVYRDAEYKRLGTLSLLAGIDLLTGEAIPLVSETHKSSDFIEFLKILDKVYQELS